VLTTGHLNPWCINNPTVDGCDLTTPGIGFDSAARVFFRALTWYIPSNVEWQDLAMYAKLAAMDLFSNCYLKTNRNGEWEQEQVDIAFQAIGYGSGTPPYQLNCVPGVDPWP
jgi:hypothetical protein